MDSLEKKHYFLDLDDYPPYYLELYDDNFTPQDL